MGTITWIAAVCCALALIPALLFLWNAWLYARLPAPARERAGVSVLIPARNEEANIEAALESVLQSEGVELEVIVLDDGSTDRTAEIVRALAARDSRVRLEQSVPIPAGWSGKNFACHQLGELATRPVLVFMDADVRVSRPDSLARLAAFLDRSGAALVSGVPHQETRGLAEKLIIPLIHFVLLGFLPMYGMRRSTKPRYAAGCGQIVGVRRESYRQIGGHSGVANSLHDGVALPRMFRIHGFATDLFDATDTFRCRMYRSAAEVWHGFAKNAREGLGAPPLIGPATVVLLGGQVAPLLLLALADTPSALRFAAIGTLVAYLPRLIAALRFRQSILGALLHPIGICLIVAIQWFALFRSLRKRPATWKGRAYSPVHAP